MCPLQTHHHTSRCPRNLKLMLASCKGTSCSAAAMIALSPIFVDNAAVLFDNGAAGRQSTETTFRQNEKLEILCSVRVVLWDVIFRQKTRHSR